VESSALEKCHPGLASNPNHLIAFGHGVGGTDVETFLSAKDVNIPMIVISDAVAPIKPDTVRAVGERVACRPIWMVRQYLDESPNAVLQTEFAAAAKGNPEVS